MFFLHKVRAGALKNKLQHVGLYKMLYVAWVRVHYKHTALMNTAIPVHYKHNLLNMCT